MKHTKSYVVLALIGLLTFSCSKDDGETIDTTQEVQVTKNILNFDSPEEINDKIKFILTLKNEKEEAVLEEMFNSKSAKTIDISEQTELTDDLINYAKEYHKRRLENIYSVREELGFTSLQSIADEINSLKLIDPSKADKLLSEHDQYLYQGKFFIKPIIQSRISEVLNLEGKLVLQNKLKDYSQENQSITANKRAVAVREGILVSNPFYAISWHAGYLHFDSGAPYVPHQYTAFTKLASLINIGGGYFSYPSIFSLIGPSEATFIEPGAIGAPQKIIKVDFGSSLSKYKYEVNELGETISIGSRNDQAFYVANVKIGRGSFKSVTATPAINPYLKLSSNSINITFN